MKSYSPNPIFTFFLFTGAIGKRINFSKYSSFSTLSNQHSVSGYQQRRQEEESRSVRVSVWWDFENCNLPANSNVFRVGQCITNAVRANGIRGPVQITAFGDVMQISRTNQEALSATGINITHVPSGGKNSADRSLLVDLMYWVSINPPPAHVFLISGDRDFAGILHRLRMNNYNILLASPDRAPSVLCSAATLMWQWSSLLKGENLTGKLFNQPPDGSYNSWYGHFKAPLEDPFAKEQCTTPCLSATDESLEALKLRPIPKGVIHFIRQILSTHPEGVSISTLRAELFKSNLVIDKEFYGAKKFSRFLLGMPHVLKLDSLDGRIVVRKSESSSDNGEAEVGGTENSPAQPQPQPQPQTPGFEKEGKRSETTKGVTKGKNCESKLRDSKKEEKEFTSKTSTQESEEQEKKANSTVKQQKVVKSAPVSADSKDAAGGGEQEDNLFVSSDTDNNSEVGIFRRTWMKLFGMNNDEKKSSEKSDGAIAADATNIEEKNQKPCAVDDNVTNLSSREYSFIDRIMSWFRFRLFGEDEVEKSDETADTSPEKLGIFFQESFWNELGSFIDTSSGASVFVQSRNRKQLVQNLQKQGPHSLRSLSQDSLHHLIDLLISDKKWIEEGDSQLPSPFKIIRPSGGDPVKNESNGLIHIFLEKQPTSSLESFAERKLQNPPPPPQSRFAQPVPVIRDLSCKPSSEMLADCYTLVDQILKDHPDGFQLGAFRRLFFEKYRYGLDLKKLGYEKLVNLLMFIPGVRIESNMIFPARVFKNLDAESSTKNDDSDSPWDELGPVDDSHSHGDKNERVQIKKALDYEPLDEDELSESEDDEPTKSINGGNTSKKAPEMSSLLEILDSWQDGKEVKAESAEMEPMRIRNPVKKYTFVTEEQRDSNAKLTNGIVGLMKKTGSESRAA